MDDDSDSYYRLNTKKRRMLLYVSFLLCMLSVALTAAAMGTQSWVQANAVNTEKGQEESTGSCNMGLFQGNSVLTSLLSTFDYTYYTVCMEGYCMFSCGNTEEDRQSHIQLILEGRLNETKDCGLEESPSSKTSRRRSAHGTALITLSNGNIKFVHKFLGKDTSSHTDDTGVNGQSKKLSEGENPLGLSKNSSEDSLLGLSKKPGEEFGLGLRYNTALGVNGAKQANIETRDIIRIVPFDEHSEDDDLLDSFSTTDSGDNDDDDEIDMSTMSGLMLQGLWIGCIVCLCGGLLFAVLGAVFAVINTATTPVEAITGITGLYIWNSLAALFELVAVILWSVQYNQHLTNNVLIVESNGGWTTEGNESLGYSFWLVVVSMIIHVANCGLIAFGTYEPKVKEKIQEPDKATNDILLY